MTVSPKQVWPKKRDSTTRFVPHQENQPTHHNPYSTRWTQDEILIGGASLLADTS